MKRLFATTLLAFAVWQTSPVVASTPSGPFYPPPLTLAFAQSGNPNDGGIGLPGGKTFSYSNAALAALDVVYWGASPAPRLSFDNPFYSLGGEVMTYTPGESSLPGGLVVWHGNTVLHSVLYGNVGINTRCRMQVLGGALVADSSVGLATSGAGGVLPITSSTMAWQATMYMEVQDTLNLLGGGGAAWVPALSFFNAAHAANSPGGAYSSFNAGFWYVNQPPVISSMANLVVTPGVSTGQIPFNINDNETPAASLGVSPSWDDHTILPNGGVTLGGSNSFRNITFQTAAGLAGVVNFTITVTDSDGGSTNRQFTITSDTPPAISGLADLLIQMNTNTGPLNFTVGDNETSAASLSVSGLSSNPGLVTNIVFGGSGSNLTVTLTPNLNQYGTSVISVIVSDGLLTATNSLTLTVNSPPSLDYNLPLSLNQGATATITSSLLHATDPESGPAGIIFTINPDGGGGPPHNGTVFKNSVPMTTGSTFTMADIQNNLITYQNNGSCDTNDDFQLGLTDANGGVWSDNGHTVFSFHMQTILVDARPVANNNSASVALGGSYNGVLSGSDPDCLNQTLSYSIISTPTNGTLTSFNSGNGQYTYTAAAGKSGLDSFTFQVSDGVYSAAIPGVVTLDIENQRPTANPASFNAQQDTPLNAALTGSDPDQPPQPLTFSVVSNGQKGSAVITNAGTGGFVYTPQPGRFGFDTFTFKVNDGLTDSAPATVNLTIRPQGALEGDLLVTDNQNSFLALINQTNGDAAALSVGGLLSKPTGVASEAIGSVLVADQNAGLLRINPVTGSQTTLVSHAQLPFPVGVAVEANGNILVGDPMAGLMRFNSSGVLITNFPAGYLEAPAGIALATNGQIFVTDVAFFKGDPAGNKILQIDPLTFSQTVLSSTGLLTSPVSIALDQNGNLLSAQLMQNMIVQIGNPSGIQSGLTTNGNLSSPAGVTLDRAGNIFVASEANGSVVAIDPVSGAQTVLLSGLGQPFGITVAGAPPSLKITGVAVVSGQFQVQFSGIAGTPYSVLGSTDATLPRANWTVLGPATEVLPGQFQFTDSQASNFQRRFYSIRFP